MRSAAGISGAASTTPHSDEQYTDISYQDNVLTDAYAISNAGLRLISPNERITVALTGRNLSNEAFCAWCIPSGPNVLGRD